MISSVGYCEWLQLFLFGWCLQMTFFLALFQVFGKEAYSVFCLTLAWVYVDWRVELVVTTLWFRVGVFSSVLCFTTFILHKYYKQCQGIGKNFFGSYRCLAATGIEREELGKSCWVIDIYQKAKGRGQRAEGMHIDWSKFQYLARDLIVLATAIYSANLSFLIRSCIHT